MMEVLHPSAGYFWTVSYWQCHPSFSLQPTTRKYLYQFINKTVVIFSSHLVMESFIMITNLVKWRKHTIIPASLYKERWKLSNILAKNYWSTNHVCCSWFYFQPSMQHFPYILTTICLFIGINKLKGI